MILACTTLGESPAGHLTLRPPVLRVIPVKIETSDAILIGAAVAVIVNPFAGC